jgi:hypothetical protein
MKRQMDHLQYCSVDCAIVGDMHLTNIISPSISTLNDRRYTGLPSCAYVVQICLHITRLDVSSLRLDAFKSQAVRKRW